jgi:putative restriction endonuclease
MVGCSAWSYSGCVDTQGDLRVRLAAFEWLRSQADLHGEVLPRSVLAEGFILDGIRIPLVGPQGIFKPRVLPDAPLSITTAPNGPYADEFRQGQLRYAYRGTDPEHPDNRGLRLAMTRQLPLVYLFGLAPGQYLPAFPAYVVGDHRESLSFDVVVDDGQYVFSAGKLDAGIAEDRADIRREYVTATVRYRLHQQAFRVRVLKAYRTQCALCRLRHQELLDAAHITADSLPEGEPVVSNGLALCKLHHAAYDRQFLTVRPDYLIEVRQSVMDEEDGPMLLHGLKGLHLKPIVVPIAVNLRPDKDRLRERYAAFTASARVS